MATKRSSKRTSNSKKKPTGRPSAITSLADTEATGNKNWLIYAPPGEGKTVLAGTAPKALFLTVEAAGTESAKAAGSDAEEWVCDSWGELQNAYEWLADGGHEEFEWVILDSVSEMEELCWKDHLEEAHEMNSSRSIYSPALQDYNTVDNKIKRLVDSFNRLPVNVIYTAGVMSLEVEDEDGDDTIKFVPQIGRTKGGAPLSNKIASKATLVGLLQARSRKNEDDERETYRRIWLEASERWIAKDRHFTFGRYVDDPNIEEMSDAVDETIRKGAKKKSKASRPKKARSDDSDDGPEDDDEDDD